MSELTADAHCQPAAPRRWRWPAPAAQELLALLILVALLLAFFWPILVGGYWLPWGGGDLASFLWPTWRLAARSLHQGVLPLWNPTLYAGAPFAADYQSSLFYPVNLVAFLIGGEPSYATMEALVLLHLLLAGVTMYALLRRRGLGRSAALLGGVAFSLSDPFITHIGNLNLLATIAYLPLLLLLSDLALERRSVGWAAAAGAVLAVAALAGHAQMLLFMGIALAGLILWRLVRSVGRGGRESLRTLGLALVILLVGVGGAAVALLPAYEIVGHTPRVALSWTEASRYSLSWQALVGLIAPDWYGRGTVSFWGTWERVEVGYLGILPLALAAAALVGAPQGARRRFALALFAGLILFGLLLALGGNTPLYRLLYDLPGFRGMRAPARAIVLADLGLAAVAAFGLEWIGASRRGQLAALVVLALTFLVALGLRLRLAAPVEHLSSARRASEIALLFSGAGLLWIGAVLRGVGARYWRPVALLLLALELILTGSLVEVERKNPTSGFRQDEIVDRLRADPNLYRIDTSAAHAWAPDAAAFHGLYDIGGIANPLNLQRYETYRWSIGARGDRLYNLLGVKYVLADKGNPPGDARLIPIYTEHPEIDIYLNQAAYPLAQLLYAAQAVNSPEAALAAIHEPGLDPAQTIILEELPQPVSPPPADQPPTLGFTGYATNALSLHVYTPTPAYLLLSEVYYPGWRASLDGQSVHVWRADYLFRAVYVPPGTHDIRLWFAPDSFRLGLALSAITWLALLAGALRAIFRRWRRRSLSVCPE